MLNATFSNISAISWRPVLVVEEAGIPGENHRHGQATGKHYHLWVKVECTRFCNLQSRARTHAALMIGLYELLGNRITKLIEPSEPYVCMDMCVPLASSTVKITFLIYTK